MGNSTSSDNTSSSAVLANSPPPPSSNDNNTASQEKHHGMTLYDEVLDMAVASFLVYSFGYVMETARRHPDAFVGLEVDESTGAVERDKDKNDSSPKPTATTSTTPQPHRTFTPHDVSTLIQRNSALLKKEFPGDFKDPTKTMTSLARLQARVDAAAAAANTTKSGSGSGSGAASDPLTLQEYDDRHQQHGLVYAVAVDRIHKRITLAFRGTDNDLAFRSNWMTNVNVSKSDVSDWPDRLPSPLEGTNKIGKLHTGFYNYLFRPTHQTDDDPSVTKLDEILNVVQPLLEANQGYALYITGHSLGGALATIVAVVLASSTMGPTSTSTSSSSSGATTMIRIPPPVTCFTFGAPRVGNAAFAQTVHALEVAGRLRFGRVVNDNDSVAALPVMGYRHVGMQVRLYRPSTIWTKKQAPPYLSYDTSILGQANADEGDNAWWWQRWSSGRWRNSFLASVNLRYDHGEYQERIMANQNALKAHSLDSLYRMYLRDKE